MLISDWSSDVCSSDLGRASGTAVQLGHDELAVLQRLGGGEPAVAGSERDVDQRIARLIEIHLAAQDAGDVKIDVLAHLSRRLRVGGQLYHRLDRVAEDVALPGWVEVQDQDRGGQRGPTH